MAKSRVALVAALAVIIVVSFLVIRSMLTTIIGAAVIAFLMYPVFRFLSRKTSRRVAAMLATLVSALIIIVPSILFINSLTQQVIQLFDKGPCSSGSICAALDLLKGVNPGLPASIADITHGLAVAASGYIKQQASGAFISISGFVLSLSILFFLVYYFLKDGRSMAEKGMALLPLSDANRQELADRTASTLYAILYGNFVVAALQGIASFIGFYLLGVPNPVFWAVVSAFAALIPVLGPAFIWMPASIIMAVDGYLAGDNFIIFRGVALFIYGALAISTIDNILRPKLIGDKANIHPVLVIVGIVGGVSAFGITGLIIGPFALSALLVFLDVAKKQGLF